MKWQFWKREPRLVYDNFHRSMVAINGECHTQICRTCGDKFMFLDGHMPESTWPTMCPNCQQEIMNEVGLKGKKIIEKVYTIDAAETRQPIQAEPTGEAADGDKPV